MCPQVEQRFRIFISPSDPIIESEDCLYLNVFVPVDVSKFNDVGGRYKREGANDRSIGLRMVIDRFLVSEQARKPKDRYSKH